MARHAAHDPYLVRVGAHSTTASRPSPELLPPPPAGDYGGAMLDSEPLFGSEQLSHTLSLDDPTGAANFGMLASVQLKVEPRHDGRDDYAMAASSAAAITTKLGRVVR